MRNKYIMFFNILRKTHIYIIIPNKSFKSMLKFLAKFQKIHSTITRFIIITKSIQLQIICKLFLLIVVFQNKIYTKYFHNFYKIFLVL
jgi:hypothetical protein